MVCLTSGFVSFLLMYTMRGSLLHPLVSPNGYSHRLESKGSWRKQEFSSPCCNSGSFGKRQGQYCRFSQGCRRSNQIPLPRLSVPKVPGTVLKPFLGFCSHNLQKLSEGGKG